MARVYNVNDISAENLEKVSALIKENKLTFYIETYGCQMNVHDSEKIGGILSDFGYIKADDIYSADFVIYNTCCVRENAENRLYGNVGKLKKNKSEKDKMILAVCGCMMQQKGAAEKLMNTFPQVDIAFGTTNMQDLPKMIASVLLKKKRVLDIKDNIFVKEELPMLRTPPPTSSVNIMQGCNNFCSYCIVPYVRGREHSRPAKDIIREVEILVANGYKEVMLLGQNVNSYDDGEFTFPMLLEAVAKTGIRRIRFMSSHPKDASLEMIRVMAKYDNICKQLHLPVQAGSTRVLKEMNRHYTREQYIDLIKEIRSIIPEIKLSSDIMIGFPGETEEEFNETLSLMEEVRYDSAFTFVYSPRKGTKAAEMPDQISEEIKKERIVKLVELQNQHTYESNIKNVGKIEDILIEDVSSRSDGYIAGKTDAGTMVNVLGSKEEIGKIIRVKIVEAKKTTLIGERI